MSQTPHTPAAPESQPMKLPSLTIEEHMRRVVEHRLGDWDRAGAVVLEGVNVLLSGDVAQPRLAVAEVNFDHIQITNDLTPLADGSTALFPERVDVDEILYSRERKAFIASDPNDLRTPAHIVYAKLWDVERALLQKAADARRAKV
jgi:hypothetical protein